MIPVLLLYKIAQLFIIMLFGFALVKLRIVKSGDSYILSKISLYLLMPATILCSFDVEITEEIRGGLLLAFAAAIGIHIIFLCMDLIYKKLAHGTAVERASIMYPNAANLIIPIVSFVLGEEWVIYSCAFITVQLVFIWTHGAQVFSGERTVNLKKILLNVNLIAIAVGAVMMLCGIRLPKFVGEISSSLGGMLGNVAMLIAGMTMASIDFKTVLKNKRLYLVLIMRMLVLPLIILGLLRLALLFSSIPNGERVLLISFLASITPSAATVMQLAQVHRKDPDFAVAINVATTLVGIGTMPLFVWLYSL